MCWQKNDEPPLTKENSRGGGGGVLGLMFARGSERPAAHTQGA